jgi:predicted glycosyltransferase
MRGLFYCHTHAAAAPLVRNLKICQNLVQDFDIDFIYGGPNIPISHDFPRFKFLQLPIIPLKRLENFLLDFDEDNPVVQEMLHRRKLAMESFISGKYDFFFTELFPFAKYECKNEILSLIDRLKRENPKCLMLCSCRDVLDLFSFQNSTAITEWILKYYDRIFVHSDPSIIRLNDTFPAANKIEEKIIYTGFVPNSNPESKAPYQSPPNTILVSIGGGGFGEPLLKGVAKAAPLLPNYHFIFILGPRSPETYKTDIEAFKCSNMTVQPFLENFEEALRHSVLSISLGGYSLIDVVKAKIPAIVYPMAYQDQRWRASRFALLGLVKQISESELEKPVVLASIILKTIHTKLPDYSINFNGAENTRIELRKVLGLPSGHPSPNT